MKNLSTLTLSTFILGMVSASAFAADPASAAGDLSEIAKISVEAKSSLADAALGGDTEAIAEAGKRSDAVDASMAQANEAFIALERAMDSGDDDVAQSAIDDIKASLEKALDALNGVIPEEVINAVQQWKDSKKNTGGGPGNPFDPPNMYDVPWDSAQVRHFYQNHFQNLWGSGLNPNDKEATPE